jgi:tetratricopeptide (TPR) repeat protein
MEITHAATRGTHGTLMPNPEGTPDNDKPFHQHSLYRLATKHLAEGQEGEAIQQLRLLTEIYPEERGLRDMLMRAEMKAALVEADVPVEERREPSAALRRMLTLLLALTVGLMVIAGFYWLYDRLVIQGQVEQARQAEIESARLDCRTFVDRGDWDTAQTECQKLLALVPGDPAAQAALQTIDEGRQRDAIYVEARTAEEGGDWQRALDLYRQLHAQDPAFSDVEQRIVALERLVALEAAWQGAQPCIEGQDWQCVIDRLQPIYQQDPSFRDPAVKDNLSRSYVELGRQRIAQAGGDVGTLRQAIDLLDQAFRLGLFDPALRQERDLANDFVRGADAYNAGDWERALTYWERVYEVNPDYQGGIVRERLREITPALARQLVEGANGDAYRLSLAVDILTLAIELLPDDPTLVEERNLAQAYVDGVQAYTLEEPDYCGAMNSWGEVFRVRPDYQTGALEERLRQACERCRFPDEALCAPQP